MQMPKKSVVHEGYKKINAIFIGSKRMISSKTRFISNVFHFYIFIINSKVLVLCEK